MYPRAIMKPRPKLKHYGKDKNITGSKPLFVARSGIIASGATNVAILIRHVCSHTPTVNVFARCPPSMRILSW